MINREVIKNVLDELGVIYRLEINKMNHDVTIDTYFINLIVDNNIINGGILDGGAPDDKHISIMFYFANVTRNGEIEENEILKKVNELNQECKYGNFIFDEDGDIVYSLAVPAIETEQVDREVFKFYFDSVILIIKSVVKDIVNG